MVTLSVTKLEAPMKSIKTFIGCPNKILIYAFKLFLNNINYFLF